MRFLCLAFALLALGSIGCDRSEKSGAPTASSAKGEAAPLADFPSRDASSWAHGAPAPLAEARGKVVLLEAWHPT